MQILIIWLRQANRPIVTKGGENMENKKITVSWYVDEALIQKIDDLRMEQTAKEKRYINRSVYLNNLIEKALKEATQ